MVAAARDPLPLQALLYTPPTHARNRRLLSTLGQSTPAARMAKMKKGKAYHWYKEEKDKVPKKSYVPTGWTCTLNTTLDRTLCFKFPNVFRPQGSLEAGRRRHQGRQNQNMSPPGPREEGSAARRTVNKISTVPSMITISAALHNQ